MANIELYNEDCMALMARYPDKYFDLAIVDPPYYEVKGDFDFVWSSFEAYLVDVERWVKGIKRVLKDNGTLFWWGHAKKIAYSQIILDKYFSLENSLVWQKTDCQPLKNAPSSMRTFAPVTERCLMYSSYNQNENDWKNNNSAVYFDGYEPIRLYLVEEIKKAGVKNVANHLGVSDRAIGHYMSKSQFNIPNEARYKQMQQLGILPKDWEAFNKEAQGVRNEAQGVRRTFEMGSKLWTDVLKFGQEVNITQKYEHPTQKPPKLTRLLLQICSKFGDNVLVPFLGSGTEAEQAVILGRNVVGSEISKDYFDIAYKRVQDAQAQQNLFF